MPDSRASISLLRAEAQLRASQVTVARTAVELDLTGEGDTFGSTTSLTFDAEPGCQTFVDFKGVELVSAILNGTPLSPTVWAGGRITLTDLAEHNTLVVEGVMAYSTDGEGLHRHVDPADQRTYLYAMSFLDAAPRWFACFDQPDLKSTYELQVAAPEDWVVVGNGPSEQLGPGRWRLRPPRPMSTYYVTLVAGPYASVYDQHDGIPLGLHVRASLRDALAAEADDLFAVTKAAFDYYHGVFGVRYPFGEYHQAFVPDFNAGAMENPGCVTFRDQYIYRARATTSERAHRAGTVAHEMAHMWFGDLVTMRWWDDLWLNESFAEYMAHRACTEATQYPLWTEFGIVRKDWGSIADQGPSTHPVAGSGTADAASALQDFDGISYAKGAAVLKQLATYVGDPVFFSGLRSYFAAHAFSNAEFADLMAAWTRAGAVDLDVWGAAWLRTSGMDTIDVVRGDRSAVVTSTPPPGQDAVRTHALQVGALDADGQLFTRSEIRLADGPVVIEVPPQTLLVIPDVGDATWAKIRCGAGSWPAVAAVLRNTKDPTTRVVLYNSLRDAVRNAELDPAAALDAICGGLLAESSGVALEAMLRYGQDQLAGPYAAPQVRNERLSQVHGVAASVLSIASPGSDGQLTAFRMAIRSCADVDLMSSWYAGHQLPAGIHLDPELVWAAVERLTLLTGDAQLIETTLRADVSAAAQVHAARARAGLPLEEAKQRAWELLTQPGAVSAYELYATADGFFGPGQEALTRAYAERYFTEVPATESFRTGWVLGQVALLAFPVPFSTPGTLALAEDTLARPDLAAPIRRSVRDETDRLRRAVASRQRFSSAQPSHR